MCLLYRTTVFTRDDKLVLKVSGAAPGGTDHNHNHNNYKAMLLILLLTIMTIVPIHRNNGRYTLGKEPIVVSIRFDPFVQPIPIQASRFDSHSKFVSSVRFDS